MKLIWTKQLRKVTVTQRMCLSWWASTHGESLNHGSLRSVVQLVQFILHYIRGFL